MIPPLTAEITPRQTAQLVVDGVHEGAAGRLRAVAPRDQQARDIRVEGHESWSAARILCRDAPAMRRFAARFRVSLYGAAIRPTPIVIIKGAPHDGARTSHDSADTP